MYQLWPCLLIEIADGYYGLGTGYMNVYDYENATRYLNIAQTMFNAIGSSAKYSRCLRVLRECHERCGRRDRAALCTDKINELEGIMVMIMMRMMICDDDDDNDDDDEDHSDGDDDEYDDDNDHGGDDHGDDIDDEYEYDEYDFDCSNHGGGGDDNCSSSSSGNCCYLDKLLIQSYLTSSSSITN